MRPTGGALKLKNLVYNYNGNMDQLDQKIEELEKKIDKLQRSIDKLRKVFLWTLILSIALIILPLIGLLFVIPQFLSSYNNVFQILQ